MKLFTGFALGALLVAEASASDRKKLTPESVANDVTKEGLYDTLESLSIIADVNGGNRAFGLSGYDDTIAYLATQLTPHYDNYLDYFHQSFNFTFEETRELWLEGPDGEDVYVEKVQYNTATPRDGVTALLVDIPVDDKRGSGCFPDQWQNINARDKIALVKRGVCDYTDVLLLAKAAGAKAVILYNDEPGTKIKGAAVDPDYYGQVVPVVLITLEVGQAWKKRLVAGESLEIVLLVDAIVEDRESWNFIVETKEGDPNNVVMLGAHLDSVQEGPGINDNGSGSAALLEIIHSFVKYTGLKNKVRFAWWGAEEVGLIGSLSYGAVLTPEEAKKIRFYFNYDMIGSLHPEYLVNANEESHKAGGKYLFDYLQRSGKTVKYGNFEDGASDQDVFLKLGIPASGLTTGFSPQNDPCYHQKCDNLNNVNWDALTATTKAAGYAAAQLALSLDGVPLPSARKNVNTKKDMAKKFASVAEKARHAKRGH